ncbi:hypothetical protein OAG71_02585 [bacterium]|nr:hypothetical protein [bacterium]
MKFFAPADMKFKDTVQSNLEVRETVSDLVFITKDGSKIKLGDYAGNFFSFLCLPKASMTCFVHSVKCRLPVW